MTTTQTVEITPPLLAPGNATGDDRRFGISDSAVRRLTTLTRQQDAAGARMRIAVHGGGCSGFQYAFSFDEALNEDDLIFARDGVEIVVDDCSLDLLNGAELNFVEEMMGQYFEVRNPNAASSCGCGTSFAIA